MVRKIYLNGIWDFVVDMDPKYHSDPRVYPQPVYAAPALNRRHWLKVPVPGVWQKYAERYDIYEGVGWFYREFSLDRLPYGSSAYLRFGGVNYFTRVFLNGEEVSWHESGFTEFTLPVSGRLKEGINCLAVMVDNRATTIKFPPVLGYFNYGGIHRDVILEIHDGVHLEDVSLKGIWEDGVCKISLSGRVIGINPDSSYEVLAGCEGVESHIPIQEGGSFAGEVPLPHLKPWSPDTPNLYPVQVSLRCNGNPVDSLEAFCGFKQLIVRQGKLYLNGQPFHLKGICYVLDTPTAGIAATQEQLETDIHLMKEMGCNAVRCHYPMDEKFYRLCDRMGLLVWIEPTVYCYHPQDEERNTAFCNPSWINLAKQMIVEMVRTARNHPCVAIYGIGNECNTAHPEARDFFAQLAQWLRSLDDTRLLSYAALYGIVGAIAEMVDVLGINSYWGWYDKVLDQKDFTTGRTRQEEDNVPKEPIDLTPMRKMLDEVIAGSRDDLVLFLTEFGADSVAGFYSRSLDLWSENYHAALIQEILKLSKAYPQIAGTFPFCFSDYRDPSKTPNGYWNELNLKGMVTYDRRKKLAFDALKQWYEQS